MKICVGFVGSSLCIQLKEKYPAYSIIAFDNLKRRDSELNLVELKENGNKKNYRQHRFCKKAGSVLL
jgi:nucleoside-diphosphate-sugar epimerase